MVTLKIKKKQHKKTHLGKAAHFWHWNSHHLGTLVRLETGNNTQRASSKDYVEWWQTQLHTGVAGTLSSCYIDTLASTM